MGAAVAAGTHRFYQKGARRQRAQEIALRPAQVKPVGQVVGGQNDDLSVMVGCDIRAGSGRQHCEAQAVVRIVSPETGNKEQRLVRQGETVLRFRVCLPSEFEKRRRDDGAPLAIAEIALFRNEVKDPGPLRPGCGKSELHIDDLDAIAGDAQHGTWFGNFYIIGLAQGRRALRR